MPALNTPLSKENHRPYRRAVVCISGYLAVGLIVPLCPYLRGVMPSFSPLSIASLSTRDIIDGASDNPVSSAH
ncbi:hypothetical protein C7967_109107 [Thalassospira sp. 11-3]|nr:hypothetical protein KO164_4439 [Thalassospira sp. KO164]PXX28817.1 hypothetical protein C7967_109107 [Thalassospira sp. 11-3]SEE91416.1 hypothetical protein SAMN04515623_4506 [Thalassospira permensis]